MEIINDSQQKIELEYPCTWSYKLIAQKKEAIQEAVEDVILEKEHTLAHSNNSKTGKYVSMNLKLLVTSEEERNFIFETLKAHHNIKMVL